MKRLKFICGCSFKISSDGYGGIDVSDGRFCPAHLTIAEDMAFGKKK